jgi:hypothetical protein
METRVSGMPVTVGYNGGFFVRDGGNREMKAVEVYVVGMFLIPFELFCSLFHRDVDPSISCAAR